MRMIKTILASAVALVALNSAAQAEYPDKPIKILVGFPPGVSASWWSSAVG